MQPVSHYEQFKYYSNITAEMDGKHGTKTVKPKSKLKSGLRIDIPQNTPAYANLPVNEANRRIIMLAN